MELIELSEDNIVKSLFDGKKDPTEIWKNAIEYSRLRQHARNMLSCFSTTYRCESTFSYMTQIKMPLRSHMTDTRLEDQLKLRTSMLQPNIQILSNKNSHNKVIKRLVNFKINTIFPFCYVKINNYENKLPKRRQ
jgi:hypothetical protein